MSGADELARLLAAAAPPTPGAAAPPAPPVRPANPSPPVPSAEIPDATGPVVSRASYLSPAAAQPPIARHAAGAPPVASAGAVPPSNAYVPPPAAPAPTAAPPPVSAVTPPPVAAAPVTPPPVAAAPVTPPPVTPQAPPSAPIVAPVVDPYLAPPPAPDLFAPPPAASLPPTIPSSPVDPVAPVRPESSTDWAPTYTPPPAFDTPRPPAADVPAAPLPPAFDVPQTPAAQVPVTPPPPAAFTDSPPVVPPAWTPAPPSAAAEPPVTAHAPAEPLAPLFGSPAPAAAPASESAGSANPAEDLDQFAALFAETGPAPVAPAGAEIPAAPPSPPDLVTPPPTSVLPQAVFTAPDLPPESTLLAPPPVEGTRGVPVSGDLYGLASAEQGLAPDTGVAYETPEHVPAPSVPDTPVWGGQASVPAQAPAAPPRNESRSLGPTPLGSFDLPSPVDADQLAKSTVIEKATLAAAVILPPIGLVAAIVAAMRSRSRRGWVIGLIRAALVLGVITTIIAVFGGVAFARALEVQRTHDAVEAASVKFCATVAKQPDMVKPPTFGWPAPAASIPDSLAAMQAYADRWTALAKVSPAGIRPDVKQMAAAATEVINSVTVSRTIDDAGNIDVMTQAVSSTGIRQWADEYCK